MLQSPAQLVLTSYPWRKPILLPLDFDPSILLFLGRESPHWKHLSSLRHMAVNNYPFHGCYLDFVGILRTLVDESLKPCQKLKQQYLSFLKRLPITFHLIQFLGGKSFLFWPNWFNYAHNRFLNWSQLSIGLKIIGFWLFVSWAMDQKQLL